VVEQHHDKGNPLIGANITNISGLSAHYELEKA
jgi:hypothetical protein